VTFVEPYARLATAVIIGAAVGGICPTRPRLVGLLCAACTFVIPAGTQLLHAWMSAPSMTLTAFATLRLIASRRAQSMISDRGAWTFLAIAAVFYPMSMGLGPFDPYDLGFRPAMLLVALAIVGAVMGSRGRCAFVVILGLDALAFSAGVFDNLWNALFDPLLTLLALIRAVRSRAFFALIGRRPRSLMFGDP
jgi:hypothetical protein